MRIISLRKSDEVYSCNSYLLLGEWNRIDDVNTLVDPGIDDFILDEIEKISTGFGKVPVEQIILTHNHFDHAASVIRLKEYFNARVYAASPGPGVDELLHDGQYIKAGDGILEVIHTPGHSSDSISLYAPEEKALFCGDTQVRVRMPGGMYTREYLDGLLKLASRKITSIYSGHDPVVREGAQQVIAETIRKIRSSTVTEQETLFAQNCSNVTLLDGVQR